jgi:hypothetical protein
MKSVPIVPVVDGLTMSGFILNCFASFKALLREETARPIFPQARILSILSLRSLSPMVDRVHPLPFILYPFKPPVVPETSK